MPDNLVIVESPAKAKTIKKYLGKDFEVLASYGHVRDLPAKDGSVRPDEEFAMDWELLLRFADAGARFACLPHYLGAFRVHSASKTIDQIAVAMAKARTMRLSYLNVSMFMG